MTLPALHAAPDADRGRVVAHDRHRVPAEPAARVVRRGQGYGRARHGEATGAGGAPVAVGESACGSSAQRRYASLASAVVVHAFDARDSLVPTLLAMRSYYTPPPVHPAPRYYTRAPNRLLDRTPQVGTTANETVIFVYEAVNFTLTQPLYELVRSLADVGYVVRIFASRLLTDGLFVCATRNASEALAVAQPGRKSPTFAFQYSHLLSWGAGACPRWRGCANGGGKTGLRCLDAVGAVVAPHAKRHPRHPTPRPSRPVVPIRPVAPPQAPGARTSPSATTRCATGEHAVCVVAGRACFPSPAVTVRRARRH